MRSLGINTDETTWMTPFDWYTFGIVIVAVPPFSSATTHALPFFMTVRVPPVPRTRPSGILLATKHFVRQIINGLDNVRRQGFALFDQMATVAAPGLPFDRPAPRGPPGSQS